MNTKSWSLVQIGIVLVLSIISLVSTVKSATIDCDIIVAGGSLAGISAAFASAQTSPELRICYTDITDWVGGQATASATSAIDFGSNWDNFPSNVVKLFGELLLSEGIGNNNASFNPGGCTVSPKCFLPQIAVDWLMQKANAYPNLSIYLNTTIIGATVDNTTGRIVALRAVQRTPTPAYPNGYERLLSQAIEDWYSPVNSSYFTKTIYDFVLGPPSGVIIEGTEFGDVLMNTAGVHIAQGMEIMNETDLVYNDSYLCGQAATVCFWISIDQDEAPQPDPTPYGSDVGYILPNISHWNNTSLDHAFIWRRSYAVDPYNDSTINLGDVFLINEQDGNDLLNSNIFLPLKDAYEQVYSGEWRGGMNLTALAMAEQRSFAYYWNLKNGTANVYPNFLSHFRLNTTTAGTTTGLAKMPYLRESRRAQHGIQDFRLCHDFAAHDNPNPGPPGCWRPYATTDNVASTDNGSTVPLDGLGFRWVDTVGIGSYGFDIHHLNTCDYPSYLNYKPDPGPSSPYYIPFRALTVDTVPNLLVVGKSMSQTFLANAVTRLHPTEVASGTAAGVAAAAMVSHGFDSLTMYKNISLLQGYLNSTTIGAPLDWNLTKTAEQR